MEEEAGRGAVGVVLGMGLGRSAASMEDREEREERALAAVGLCAVGTWAEV